MSPDLLWVNKTASSASLSHSEDSERLALLSQAQRTSRLCHTRKKPRDWRSRSKEKSRHDRCHYAAKGADSRDDQLVERTFSSREKELLERRSPRHRIKPIPSMDPDWTSEERRGVDFFLRVTVFKIINLNRDAVFWKEMLPPLTRLQPAFRHLVVAISSTHELLFDKDPEKLNFFAMTQCNKATHLLRASGNMKLELLLASCILVSAYSLLRCDLSSADMSIESGLKMAAQSEDDSRDDLKRILITLGRKNGFKLWAPDITYQFEKANLASESLSICEGSIIGPFIDTEQVLAAYRTLNVEVVAKIMRNLARGAYVDPHCSVSREIVQQLGMFSFYFEQYSAQIPPECADTQMELKQLWIGFSITYLIFHTKVIAPTELTFEAHINVCRNVMELAEEIVNARHASQSVKYIDRIVNVALFSFGLACRESRLRHRAIALLQSQWRYEDGLVNYLRGMIIYMINIVEERVLDVHGNDGSFIRRRLTLAGIRCREDDRMVCLECILAPGGERRETWFDWEPSFDVTVSAYEINNCLQGIMTGYRMYGKPTMSQAPHGYVREMYFRGRPVPVHWSEGCSPLD